MTWIFGLVAFQVFLFFFGWIYAFHYFYSPSCPNPRTIDQMTSKEWWFFVVCFWFILLPAWIISRTFELVHRWLTK